VVQRSSVAPPAADERRLDPPAGGKLSDVRTA
jgi:hypothetical protein